MILLAWEKSYWKKKWRQIAPAILFRPHINSTTSISLKVGVLAFLMLHPVLSLALTSTDVRIAQQQKMKLLSQQETQILTKIQDTDAATWQKNVARNKVLQRFKGLEDKIKKEGDALIQAYLNNETLQLDNSIRIQAWTNNKRIEMEQWRQKELAKASLLNEPIKTTQIKAIHQAADGQLKAINKIGQELIQGLQRLNKESQSYIQAPVPTIENVDSYFPK